MNSAPSSPGLFPRMGIDLFLRSEAELLRQWAVRRPAAIGWFCAGSIIIGAGFYGAAMGSWRDGWQALYTGIKLPLVILLLAGCCAPLSGTQPGRSNSLGNNIYMAVSMRRFSTLRGG